MRYLPAWLVDAMLNDSYTMVPRAKWSPEGRNWYDLRPMSGNHTQDATQQTRWNMSGEFAPDYPVSDLGIHPYGCRLKLWMEIRTTRNPAFLLPSGEYMITQVQENRQSIALTGLSYEQEIIESEFSKPRRIPDGPLVTYQKQIETLVTEAYPGARFIWDPRLKGLTDRPPRAHYDNTRWDVVAGDLDADSLVNALGAVLYCDYSGVFNIEPIPALSGVPVWTVRSSDVMVSNTSTLDRTGIKNVLTVAGETYTGDGVGPAFAWDRDPHSITYAGPDPINNPGVEAAPYGVKAVKYTNSLISSDFMAMQVARARINNYLGIRKEVTFVSKMHPGLMVGDVVGVEENNSTRIVPHIIDSIQHTWGDATVSCVTRSTKAGDLSDLS